MSHQRLRELILRHSYREGDFTLASGKKSRYYVDIRRTALTAEGGTLVGPVILDAIDKAGWKPDAIGGLTLGADPLTTSTAIAAFQAGRELSSFLVRKAPKGHGAGKQVEAAGDLAEGASVVVLEDTLTTGGSARQAIAALRREGYNVIGAIAVVDRQEGGVEALAEDDVQCHALFTIDDLRT